MVEERSKRTEGVRRRRAGRGGKGREGKEKGKERHTHTHTAYLLAQRDSLFSSLVHLPAHLQPSDRRRSRP